MQRLGQSMLQVIQGMNRMQENMQELTNNMHRLQKNVKRLHEADDQILTVLINVDSRLTQTLKQQEKRISLFQEANA